MRQLADQVEAEKAGLALVALPDRSILLSGGRSPAGFITGDLLVIDAGDDQFRPSGTLAIERERHTASVGLGGVVYLIGGLTHDEVGGGDVATGTIELYRPKDRSVRTLEGAELRCSWHGCRYDVRTGQRLDGPERIAVFPVAVESGEIRVAIGVEPVDQA